MNKIKSILRISVLLAIAFIAFYGTLCGVSDDSPTWASDLLITKVIGLSSFFILARLYRHWLRDDEWLRKFEKSCKS